MKYTLFILVILLFLSIGIVTALRLDCIDRGAVSLELLKGDYFPGERLQGKIIITNKNTEASTFIYTIKLSKDNYIPWEITKRKDIGPGTQILNLHQVFGGYLSTPYTAEIGRWKLQFITQVDDCLWYDEKIIGIFTCSDGIQNGDERGIDCGGSCQLKCPTSTKFPGQVIFHKGYHKQKSKIWTNMDINPIPTASTYKEGKWINGNQISLSIPESADVVAAYGCCCAFCNNEFKCNIYSNNRYKVQTYDEWECGWNIKYL